MIFTARCQTACNTVSCGWMRVTVLLTVTVNCELLLIKKYDLEECGVMWQHLLRECQQHLLQYSRTHL